MRDELIGEIEAQKQLFMKSTREAVDSLRAFPSLLKRYPLSSVVWLLTLAATAFEHSRRPAPARMIDEKDGI